MIQILKYENYQNVTQRYKVSNRYCKNCPSRLALHRVPRDLQFVKNRFLQSTIKRNMVK